MIHRAMWCYCYASQCGYDKHPYAVMTIDRGSIFNIVYSCTFLYDLYRKWPSSSWKRSPVILRSCHVVNVSLSWRLCAKDPSSSLGSVTLDSSPSTTHWRSQSRHHHTTVCLHHTCTTCSVTVVWSSHSTHVIHCIVHNHTLRNNRPKWYFIADDSSIHCLFHACREV